MVESTTDSTEPSQIQIEVKTDVVVYPGSSDLFLLTFSYLHGFELFHKIAVTSKKIRESLPNAGLLDQTIIIGIVASDKDYPEVIPPIKSFLYAVSLADSIRVTIDKNQIEYAKWVKALI